MKQGSSDVFLDAIALLKTRVCGGGTRAWTALIEAAAATSFGAAQLMTEVPATPLMSPTAAKTSENPKEGKVFALKHSWATWISSSILGGNDAPPKARRHLMFGLMGYLNSPWKDADKYRCLASVGRGQAAFTVLSAGTPLPVLPYCHFFRRKGAALEVSGPWPCSLRAKLVCTSLKNSRDSLRPSGGVRYLPGAGNMPSLRLHQ